jgi:hypothetical protein
MSPRAQVRVVTWNAHIARKRPRMTRRLTKAGRAIDHIAERSDAAVFQEFGQHTPLLRHAGFDHWDPHGSRPPHLWRTRALDCLGKGTRRLAKGRVVGRIPGFRAVLDDYLCTITRHDTPEGYRISVIGVHLPAHVEHPRGKVAKTKRGRMWTDCVVELAQVMEGELSAYHEDTGGADLVIVLGDWNMRLSATSPFRPILELGAKKVRPHAPTHRGREIDGGFYLAAPGVDVDLAQCHVMNGPGLPNLSAAMFDHRPVHATLALTRSDASE